mmetsp:Transcript_68444/g.189391  ORF Transcript_68444/g.189391 Transcript_68444/m.189391 type:complete len:210 (+) Transcript_68444:601-1230(+)
MRPTRPRRNCSWRGSRCRRWTCALRPAWPEPPPPPPAGGIRPRRSCWRWSGRCRRGTCARCPARTWAATSSPRCSCARSLCWGGPQAGAGEAQPPASAGCLLRRGADSTPCGSCQGAPAAHGSRDAPPLPIRPRPRPWGQSARPHAGPARAQPEAGQPGPLVAAAPRGARPCWPPGSSSTPRAHARPPRASTATRSRSASARPWRSPRG